MTFEQGAAIGAGDAHQQLVMAGEGVEHQMAASEDVLQRCRMLDQVIDRAALAGQLFIVPRLQLHVQRVRQIAANGREQHQRQQSEQHHQPQAHGRGSTSHRRTSNT